MEIELKVPNVGEFIRHAGTLIAIEEVKPPPPPISREYIFQEVEARIELRLKDEVIKRIGDLNDFYGLETSIKTAIKEAKEYAVDRELGENSDLEVIVISITRQYRAKPTWQENIFTKGYTEFEHLMTHSTRGLPSPDERVVWSSKSK